MTDSSATIPKSADKADSNWPFIGIVVLTWENYEDTAECLKSLRTVDYPNYDVIVVDNGSTDGSRARLLKKFDWCEFVLNDTNRGFACGNNPGIKRAISMGAEYVLLLNNDTVVPADFLTPLVNTAEAYADVAAVGGVQYRYDSDEVLYAGSRFFPYLGGRVSPHQRIRDDKPYEVSYVPSSLILLDTEFVREHDVLHEGYFLGMDDVDLAVQARRAGKRVMIDPKSTIRHKEGLTRDRTPFIMYHWIRNRLEFGSQRLSVYQRVPFYIMLFLMGVQLSLSWLYKGREDLLHSLYVAIKDQYAGNGFRSYEFFE